MKDRSNDTLHHELTLLPWSYILLHVQRSITDKMCMDIQLGRGMVGVVGGGGIHFPNYCKYGQNCEEISTYVFICVISDHVPFNNRVPTCPCKCASTKILYHCTTVLVVV